MHAVGAAHDVHPVHLATGPEADRDPVAPGVVDRRAVGALRVVDLVVGPRRPPGLEDAELPPRRIISLMSVEPAYAPAAVCSPAVALVPSRVVSATKPLRGFQVFRK